MNDKQYGESKWIQFENNEIWLKTIVADRMIHQPQQNGFCEKKKGAEEKALNHKSSPLNEGSVFILKKIF